MILALNPRVTHGIRAGVAISSLSKFSPLTSPYIVETQCKSQPGSVTLWHRMDLSKVLEEVWRDRDDRSWKKIIR